MHLHIWYSYIQCNNTFVTPVVFATVSVVTLYFTLENTRYCYLYVCMWQKCSALLISSIPFKFGLYCCFTPKTTSYPSS